MVEYLCSMLIVKGQIFGASFSDWKYLFIVLDMILKLFVGPMKDLCFGDWKWGCLKFEF